MVKSRYADQQELLAVGNTPAILSPGHLTGVLEKVRPGDVVVDADFRTPRPRMATFDLVGGDSFLGDRIANGVIDGLFQKQAAQPFVVRKLVGEDGAARIDLRDDRRHGLVFGLADEGYKPAPPKPRPAHASAPPSGGSSIRPPPAKVK